MPFRLNFSQYTSGTVLPYTIVILLWAVAFPGYHTYVGMDQVNYLAIAEQYAAGEFSATVNAYWSPLMSWVLALPIALGIERLLAYQVLVVLMLIFSVWAVARLCYQLRLRRLVSTVVQVASSVPLVFFANLGFLPDSLSTALLIAFLAQAIVVWRTNNWMSWVALAILALAAAFAKQYNLWFVLCIFALTISARAWRQREKQPEYSFSVHLRSFWKKASTAALMLFIGIGTWVTVLSLKYDRLMWSTAGAYNLELAHCHGRQPMQQAFTPPIATHRYSSWQEPTVYDWPTELNCDSRDGLSGFLQETHIALHTLLERDFEWLFLCVLLPALILGFRWRRTTVLLLLLAGAYTLPYVFVVVNPRYLLFSLLLVLIAAGLSISKLRLRWLRLVLVLLLVWVGTGHDGRALLHYWQPEVPKTNLLSKRLDAAVKYNNYTPNFAVFGNKIRWADGQRLAFETRGRFYGRVTPQLLRVQPKLLDAYRIDMLISNEAWADADRFGYETKQLQGNTFVYTAKHW